MTSPPMSAPGRTAAGIIESLARLQDLDDLPTAEHVARFTAMHDSLAAALSSIDDV